ncbi:MAG TPA: cyclodeaminase/cyclohydrolase family protein [Gaiellaceae bacterium]|nr:cyclodeaminase/cyclohydrolase family protein [Gaiellaceae bacterium]
MASPRDFLDLSGRDWLAELAAADVAPGGGSALAAALAGGAAVLAMAARTSGAGGLAAQAVALVARTAPLAQHDAEVYAAALAARDLARGDLTQEQRDWEIGRAFAEAAEPPLELARAAADVAALARELATTGEPRVQADAAAVAALAAGIARGAAALVAVNLTALEGDPRVAEAATLATAAEDAAAHC